MDAPGGVRRQWRYRGGAALALLLALGLTACEEMPARATLRQGWEHLTQGQTPAALRAALEQAPDCCGSLADLPYATLDHAGSVAVELGPGAPAHRFETGKSWFAAWRIAGLPRPARLVVSSFRATEPGSLAQELLPEARRAVLQPTVLLLDAQFAVVQRIEARQPRRACAASVQESAFQLPLFVDGPPAQASYLVVLSSADALDRTWKDVCGTSRSGLDPAGRISVLAQALATDDLPLRMVAPVKWYAGARGRQDVSFWQGVSASPGLLVLGRERLEFLRGDGVLFQPELVVPYRQVVRAHADDASAGGLTCAVSVLVPPAPSGTPARLDHHLFDWDYARDEAVPDATTVAHWLSGHTSAGLALQAVRWQVSVARAELEVSGGPLARIGAAAVLGGGVTAMPCGLCQTGACTPEMLGSCAALFGVGAMLGGGTGVVREMLGLGPGDGDPAALALLRARAARGAGLADGGLQQCLADAVARSPEWQEGGLAARLVPPLAAGAPIAAVTATPEGVPGAAEMAAPVAAPGAAAAAAPAVVPDATASVELGALVLEPSPAEPGVAPTAEQPGLRRLRIEVRLRLQVDGGPAGRTAVRSWLSPAHPLAEWAREDAVLVEAYGKAACASLAGQLVEAAQVAWRED